MQGLCKAGSARNATLLHIWLATTPRAFCHCSSLAGTLTKVLRSSEDVATQRVEGRRAQRVHRVLRVSTESLA